MDFPHAEMIAVNGIELEVFQAGEGGKPIVLCHGWPEHAFSWRYQLPALVEAGYHCIIPNQRGYGRSSQPESVEEYDIHHLSGDHAALLDVLGIDQAVYVGHDWGAIVLWQHAYLQPDRVKAVANLSVPLYPRAPSDPVAFWEEMLGPDFYIVHFNRQPGVAAEAFDNNTERFLRNMYRTKQWLEDSEPQPSGQMITKFADQAFERGELMMSEEELAVFVEAFNESGFKAPCNWYRNFSRNWETTADVPHVVNQPALMIYGRYDMVPTADMSEYVTDLETHTLECGHWIQQEKPGETNALLLDWLERRGL